MEAFAAVVAPFLAQVIVLVLGALVVLARTRVNQWLEQKIDNEKHEAAAKQLNDLVWDTVLAAEQTIVKGAKEHLTAGKLSTETYRSTLAMVRSDVISVVHAQALPQLQVLGVTLVSDQLDLLRTKVEAAVAKTKLSGRSDSIVTGTPQLPKL